MHAVAGLVFKVIGFEWFRKLTIHRFVSNCLQRQSSNNPVLSIAAFYLLKSPRLARFQANDTRVHFRKLAFLPCVSSRTWVWHHADPQDELHGGCTNPQEFPHASHLLACCKRVCHAYAYLSYVDIPNAFSAAQDDIPEGYRLLSCDEYTQNLSACQKHMEQWTICLLTGTNECTAFSASSLPSYESVNVFITTILIINDSIRLSGIIAQ